MVACLRRRLPSLLVLGAVFAATVGGGAGFIGAGRAAAGSPDDVADACPTALVIGDSLMTRTADAVARLAAMAGPEQCVNVVNEARAGTGPAAGAIPFDWPGAVPALLDTHEPDFVVAHFGGNSTVPGALWGTKDWHRQTRRGVFAIIDAVQARGIPMYWSRTPVSHWFCDASSPVSSGWPRYRRWVRQRLPIKRPGIETIDWHALLTPRDRFRASIVVNGERIRVRAPDCIHLTERGAELVAALVFDRVAGELAGANHGWRTGSSVTRTSASRGRPVPSPTR